MDVYKSAPHEAIASAMREVIRILMSPCLVRDSDRQVAVLKRRVRKPCDAGFAAEEKDDIVVIIASGRYADTAVDQRLERIGVLLQPIRFKALKNLGNCLVLKSSR